MEKIQALANYLKCDVEELEQTTYDENTFEYGNQEYLVLTDEEADQRTKQYIEETLWAFNANFILDHSNVNDRRTEKAIRKMQEKLCEDANEIVKALITDIDEFVQDAISADGRGHFLSRYDGEENEEEEYFIYRTN